MHTYIALLKINKSTENIASQSIFVCFPTAQEILAKQAGLHAQWFCCAEEATIWKFRDDPRLGISIEVFHHLYCTLFQLHPIAGERSVSIWQGCHCIQLLPCAQSACFPALKYFFKPSSEATSWRNFTSRSPRWRCQASRLKCRVAMLSSFLEACPGTSWGNLWHWHTYSLTTFS